MEVCERLGIPLRRLHGWEPASTTEYKYDAQGRIAETRTVREPEWDQWDHYLMVALSDWRRSLCPNCGEPRSECMVSDDVPEGELPKLSARLYESGYGRCISCFRISYEQGVLRSMEEGKKDVISDHRKWYVKKLGD